MRKIQRKIQIVAFACVLAGCGFEVTEQGELELDAASEPSDASIDAAPVFSTLRQTADGVIDPAVGARCALASSGHPSGDQAWFRVFDLAAEGITGTFALTDVHLRLSYAHLARGVTIKVGTYAGPSGAAIAMAGATWLASNTVDMPEAGGPFDVNIGGSMPVVTISAGSRLIVGIVAPSYQATGGEIRLGFTDASESSPSYFTSAACGVSGQSTEAMGAPGHLVLEVSGWVR